MHAGTHTNISGKRKQQDIFRTTLLKTAALYENSPWQQKSVIVLKSEKQLTAFEENRDVIFKCLRGKCSRRIVRHQKWNAHDRF